MKNFSSKKEVNKMNPQIGHIIELVPTIDVNKTNEYMLVTDKGLYFIKIKKLSSGSSIFRFKFSSDEHYFSEETI